MATAHDSQTPRLTVSQRDPWEKCSDAETGPHTALRPSARALATTGRHRSWNSLEGHGRGVDGGPPCLSTAEP